MGAYRLTRSAAIVALVVAGLGQARCRGDQGCGAPRPGVPAQDASDAHELGDAMALGDEQAGPPSERAATPDVAPEHPESSSPPGESSDEGVGVSVGGRRCPKDMVEVDRRFCIDRYECTLVDHRSGQALSPHYPPLPGVPLRMFDKWQSERWKIGPENLRSMPLPILPDIERSGEFVPRAVSRRGVIPQGYASGKMASAACAHAGKRLCTIDEWRYACRGQRQTKFPYGETYVRGTCNVDREQHPAALLHGNASIGHSDPRLGLVTGSDGPLVRKTGTTPKCASRWGKDAIHDMVGNMDEWIDDPAGTFVGGFFSRTTREGCESTIRTHVYDYWDYSLGIRCCRSFP